MSEIETIGSFFVTLGIWVRAALIQSWHWFNALSYQEWFVVLGFTALVGFLCMRGFGSRSNY